MFHTFSSEYCPRSDASSPEAPSHKQRVQRPEVPKGIFYESSSVRCLPLLSEGDARSHPRTPSTFIICYHLFLRHPILYRAFLSARGDCQHRSILRPLPVRNACTHKRWSFITPSGVTRYYTLIGIRRQLNRAVSLLRHHVQSPQQQRKPGESSRQP